MKRKSPGETSGSKHAKTTQVWDRDIVCLPKCSDPGVPLSFPHGRYRTKLGENGLIGKIRLTTSMSVTEVEEEVRSVFQTPMGGKDDFRFQFLQSTGAGTKTLTVPSVSSSFLWTPQQVAKLGSSKQAIYIIALDELSCSLESEVSEVYCILAHCKGKGLLNHTILIKRCRWKGWKGSASSQYTIV